MNKKEVILTLLQKKIPDRIGLNEHFWPYIIENSWEKQGFSTDTDFVKEFDLDLRSVLWADVPQPRADLVKVVEETDEWEVKRDGWGASFKYWKHKGGTPEHIDFTINSPAVWREEFRDAVIATKPQDACDVAKAKKAFAAAQNEDIYVTMSTMLVFEMLRAKLGDVYMLESLMLEKDMIHDFNTVITDKQIEIWEYMFKEVGMPDGIHVYEDLGYTAAPFCGPDLHREMIMPYHKKMFSFLKDHGLPIIFHTCGDFRVHLPAIVEAGADCVQAMEAKTGMDVVELAKDWGDKLCFMGNINIQALETHNKDKIEEEVLHKLKGMKQARAPYVFMSDHSIPPTVDVADYMYMLELYHANKMY